MSDAPPKSMNVRIPAALAAWLEEHARQTHRSQNATIVLALETLRDSVAK